jgi:hypothetical protein
MSDTAIVIKAEVNGGKAFRRCLGRWMLTVMFIAYSNTRSVVSITSAVTR